MKVDFSVKPFLGGAEAAGGGDGAGGELDISMASIAVLGGSDLGARVSISM